MYGAFAMFRPSYHALVASKGSSELLTSSGSISESQGAMLFICIQSGELTTRLRGLPGHI